MQLGKLDIFPVSDGFFRLDGGAMFGIVPKLLWEKKITPDENNRIQMGLWCLLIKSGNLNILVNTGVGPDEKYTPRYRQIYQIQHPPALLTSLAEHNIKPEDINIVVNTHLHFDHSGGNTKQSKMPDGTIKYIPAFPKAKYIIQKAEWVNATNATERTRASYYKENILPLEEHNQLELIDGDKEIAPGISVLRSGGHTKGHQVIILESEGKKGIFWSDLMPTTAHLDLPYIMSYDLFPEETMDQKKKLIEQAISENWLCFWEHDPKTNCGYIKRIDNKLTIVPA
jgi:glyoxylase-like metal-dependent hydrolase (beta-lactamase superfamily II)